MTDQTKTPELKPCPFCGGEARMNKTWSPDYNGKGKAFYWVACKRSTCEGKSGHRSTKNMSAVKWNRRADATYPVTKEDAMDVIRDLNDFTLSFSDFMDMHEDKIRALLEAAAK